MSPEYGATLLLRPRHRGRPQASESATIPQGYGTATVLIQSERSSCAACGVATTVPQSYAGTEFCECRHCGYATLATSGREDYWDAGGESSHLAYWESAREPYFLSALARLAALVPGRRLLDVGGGIGYFSDLALREGWDAYSLDSSPRATELAAKRIGAERAWPRIPAEQMHTFDIVTLWCVVAHTREPEAIVAAARTALRNGGVLWLTTPNFSFQRPYARGRRLIRRRLDFARDDHVGHFTARAITALLCRNAFDDVRFNYVGITETCIALGSNARVAVAAKRLWNRTAYAAVRRGLPNLMSEHQITARAT